MTNQLLASAEQVLAALRVALPGVRCESEPEGVVGYGNDRWILNTSRGKLLAKVGRFPLEPTQVDRQVRAQRWLADIGFPTPELIHAVAECTELDGRRFSVQRYVESEPDDLVQLMDAKDFEAFFGDLGAAVGVLHSLALPRFDGWVDYRGRSGASWSETIRPTDALRRLRDHGTIVPPEVVAEVERRIDRGLAALPEIEPRLVHRELLSGGPREFRQRGFANRPKRLRVACSRQCENDVPELPNWAGPLARRPLHRAARACRRTRIARSLRQRRLRRPAGGPRELAAAPSPTLVSSK